MKTKRPILLAEDDEVDAMTVKRALQELKVANPLVITGNGEEALAYLRGGAKKKPCVVLLDLKMPKMDGIEFLKVVKQDHQLRRIPVIVLTTSKEEQDRVHSFDLSVAGYMVKPVEYVKLVEVMRTVDLYWTLSELAEVS